MFEMQEALKTTFDTRSVPRRHRLDYWEEKCSADVVGLSCSSMEEDGFQARFDHFDFGTFSVFDIEGKQHVIERPPEFVRTREKDSVFFAILMHGSSFVNRANQCVLVNQGDCVLYDTNKPYMHGFPTAMRHVIFDLPGDEFRARFPSWQLFETVRLNGSSGPGISIAQALRSTFSKVLSRKYLAPDPTLVDEVWAALESAYGIINGHTDISAYHLGALIRAKKFIGANLSKADLSAEMVAQEVGMSVRHLNRLLALEGKSIKSMIIAQRLERARRDIEQSVSRHDTMAEISYRWGFNSQAHFSRSFKEHFGLSPTDVRGVAPGH
jgi:AraC-like DNA-binding protein